MIASTDLILYDAVNEPTDDTSTAGGAIDLTSRAAFTQFSAPAKLSLVSDGADTRVITVIGRLSTGSIVTETPAMNGATEVLTTNTFERLLSVSAATGDAARTITLKQGTGGTTIGTITPNEKKRRISFANASSAPTIQTRYEKLFGLNNHGTLSLLGAALKLTADPSSVIMIGAASAVNDTATITNRMTAPSSVTFVDDNVSVGVPGTDLAAGAKIGCWVQQTLAANAVAGKSSYTVELSGGSV